MSMRLQAGKQLQLLQQLRLNIATDHTCFQ